MAADPEAEVGFWTDDMGAVPVKATWHPYAWRCETCGVPVLAHQAHTCVRDT
jgi:hypothetical protein